MYNVVMIQSENLCIQNNLPSYTHLGKHIYTDQKGTYQYMK